MPWQAKLLLRKNLLGCPRCLEFCSKYAILARPEIPDIRRLQPPLPRLRHTPKNAVVVPADTYLMAHVTRCRYLHTNRRLRTLGWLATATDLLEEGHGFAETFCNHTQSQTCLCHRERQSEQNK